MIASDGNRPKEAVMGQAIPSQHPRVVLRSQFNQLRALLAVAVIAVIGLTVAVVILANDEQSSAGNTSPAAATGPLQYGAFNPRTEGETSSGPDESRTAEAVGFGDDASAPTGGPDESTIAGAVAGR
jgi:hypothetical protein